MKQILNMIVIMCLFFLPSCGQKQMKTPDDADVKFEEFIKKEKFLQDDKLFYPGIGNLGLKPVLTENINLLAGDFKKLADKGISTDKEYQNAIKNGFDRFSDIYQDIDTEDRERICSYVEELMDIVGLDSSDGHLNNFMYDFDPTKE